MVAQNLSVNLQCKWQLPQTRQKGVRFVCKFFSLFDYLTSNTVLMKCPAQFFFPKDIYSSIGQLQTLPINLENGFIGCKISILNMNILKLSNLQNDVCHVMFFWNTSKHLRIIIMCQIFTFMHHINKYSQDSNTKSEMMDNGALLFLVGNM